MNSERKQTKGKGRKKKDKIRQTATEMDETKTAGA